MSSRNIEAIYPLSPMQQGMLFESLYAPESGGYLEQFNWTLQGRLDITSLKRAWQRVLDRHSILRTAFVWEGVDESLQVVGQRVKLPVEELDWRGLTTGEQQRRLEDFLVVDRSRGFDISRAPLMRLTIIRMAESIHNLVWSHHHLLLDGWSAPLLLNEVSAFYDAFSNGREIELEHPRPYGDYIAWLQKQDFSKAEEFWRETLKGFKAPTPLGVDGLLASPHDPASVYDQHQLSLSAAATEKLKALARQHQLTFNTLVQGAWAILLSRYSGEDDVVFGTVVSGRPPDLPAVESMVGMFINTIPVRVTVAPEESLLRWLDELQNRLAEARQYEYSPVAQVQGWSEVPRDLPLFESVFVFDNYPANHSSAPEGSPLKVSDVHLSERATSPLTVVAAPATELRLQVFYDCSRFDPATIRRMLGHWMTLLEDMADRPERQLSDLRSITQAEQEQILVEWGNECEDPQKQLLHKLFEAQVEKNPDAAAISFGGEVLSYGSLNASSNQVADGLRQIGAGAGQITAVMLDSGPLQIVTLFGALKAGSAYVCLDANYPPARLKKILEEIEVNCVLSDSNSLKLHEELYRELRQNTGCQLVCLNQEDEQQETNYSAEVVNGSRWFRDCSTDNPDTTVDPCDLAYVVFTSGSTGQPKGIMQSHRSFCQFLSWQSEYFEMRAPKRIAQWAAITYDASYCEIFGALCFGATLCMTSTFTRYDPAALVEWVKHERVSLLQVVPSFCRQILQAVQSRGREANPFPDLKSMLLAGETVPIDLAREWLDCFAGSNKLFNLYGPSETVLATYYPIERINPGQKSIPIGRAFDGRQVLILDQSQKLCPIGVKGEIYIRSRFLTDGYWRQPEESKHVYLQNPLQDKYADPVYRAGDLGRWLPDGNIEFFGRKDNQIKIRGIRVELEEIQSALLRNDLVSECVVAPQEFEGGDQRLIAYVVGKSNHEESKDKAVETMLTQLESQYISQCQTVYDEIYSLNDAFSRLDSGISLRAWTSSYTNEPLAEDEIIESVNDTVERILSLRPKKVLEIGSGTGLLLSRVAPHCMQYYGTDISERAVELLKRQLAQREPELSRVTVSRMAAHEAENLGAGSFDLVVMNLVTQHFPSVQYLMRVLQSATKVLSPGGFIFVGGVRSLPLLEIFQTSVRLYQSPPSLTKTELRRQVQERLASEKDLVIDPDFFTAVKQHLPRVRQVKVQPKGGRHHNEITRYQYDVIMQVDSKVTTCADTLHMDWQKETLNLNVLQEHLREAGPDRLTITNIPDARLETEIKAAELVISESGPETVGEIKRVLAVYNRAGVEPDDLRELANELCYDIDLSWSGSGEEGHNEVVLRRRSQQSVRPIDTTTVYEVKSRDGWKLKPWGEYANNPLRARLAGSLGPELRGFLQNYLPEHMIPSAFVFLESLPRTRTGKIDRNALPRPENRRPETANAYLAPRTELESIIAGIWQDILKVDRVGVQDNFFGLGGHSLLATQVVNRIRERCLIDLPLRSFFDTPTIAALAERLEAARKAGQDGVRSIARIADEIKGLSSDEVKALLHKKKLLKGRAHSS